MNEVTQILNRIEDGNANAAGELIPLVYSELRRIAIQKMENERNDQMLQPTALVHEAFLRLVGEKDLRNWDNRWHFFSAASEAMRRILIENARQKKSLKRGGGKRNHEIREDDAIINESDFDQLIDLDAALTRLAESEPEMAKLVELRFFTGLSIENTAKALGISVRTVNRSWALARAWLGREMKGDIRK